MRNLFTDHPDSVGESYFEHMGVALGFAMQLFGAAFACLVHGIFPFLFTRTGSTKVKELHERMTAARRGPKRVTPDAGHSAATVVSLHGDRA